ncbi:MAG: purine-nucleoside phosphorylase [Lachnospiraceae bacterium]|nr:purine-nucleoside phosphorylase [Lachnospiraceae bacterium]
MATPHNEAEKGMIAKTVLMPGDPLRAKFIAETYLENPVCFNTVRNMLGYTGTYEGKKVSVMGGGMGMPSIGIYSYELFNFYDVDTIIRIGSAGGLQEDVNVMDIVIAQGACTDSNYAYQYELPGTFAPIGSFDVLEKAVKNARELGVEPKVGNVVSADIFYNQFTDCNKKWADMGALCVEMEAAALYMNAAKAHKKALAILTISDHLFKTGELSPEERQKNFRQMMEIALKTAE